MVVENLPEGRRVGGGEEAVDGAHVRRTLGNLDVPGELDLAIVRGGGGGGGVRGGGARERDASVDGVGARAAVVRAASRDATIGRASERARRDGARRARR